MAGIFSRFSLASCRYRHKAMFDRIMGGAGLTKNGSHTNAQQIRDLKVSGANTSVNLKDSMPADTQCEIKLTENSPFLIENDIATI